MCGVFGDLPPIRKVIWKLNKKGEIFRKFVKMIVLPTGLGFFMSGMVNPSFAKYKYEQEVETEQVAGNLTPI